MSLKTSVRALLELFKTHGSGIGLAEFEVSPPFVCSCCFKTGATLCSECVHLLEMATARVAITRLSLFSTLPEAGLGH